MRGAAEGRYVPAPDCRTVHPYGEEGWRPGGPDQPHEHWVSTSGVDDAERRLLSDPDRPARVDAALADPVERAYRRDVLVTVLIYHRPTATSGCHCGWDVLGASQPEHVADEYEAMVAGEA